MPTLDEALACADVALKSLERIDPQIVPSRTSAVFDARQGLAAAVEATRFCVRKLETAKEQEAAMVPTLAKGRKR